jgi:hypothetical protein
VWGNTGMKLLMDSFRKSRDPYGNPWKPVVRNRKKDRRARARRIARGLPVKRAKPLLDTGRLRASAALNRVGPEGFEIVMTADYAGAHQYGAKIQRKGGAYAVDKRGRFVSRKKTAGRPGKTPLARGQSTRVRFYPAYTITIPRRQMLPEADTGGLGPIWTKALERDAKKVVKAHFKAAGGEGEP